MSCDHLDFLTGFHTLRIPQVVICPGTSIYHIFRSMGGSRCERKEELGCLLLNCQETAKAHVLLLSAGQRRVH